MKARRLVAPAVAAGLILASAAAGCGRPVRAPALLAVSDFEDGRAEAWLPSDPDRWRVAADGGSMVYELTAPGAPGPVRAPTSLSLLAGHDVASFEFTGRLRCDADPTNPHRDLCVIFHYRGPTRFGYVHFAGSSDEVHNIIGLVDGADRVKINAEPAGGSVFRLTDRAWHAFKVTCDPRTGAIRAYLDDLSAPILTAPATPLGHGLVGVGSFDDTGAFDDLVLTESPMSLRNALKSFLGQPDGAAPDDACILLPDAAALDEAVRARDKLMVLVYASWCPYSQAFLKTYLAHASKGDPCYARIIVDDNDPLVDRYAVNVFPTVLFFERGALARRLDGVYHRGLTQRQLEDFARRCAVK